jgi:hypothetical protein
MHLIRKLTAIVVLLAAVPASAEPMHFEDVSNGGNCEGCAYVQATGEITSDTSKEFEAFEARAQYPADIVRLNSPGGSLAGGIALGELFRSRGISTEVGSSAPITGVPRSRAAGRSPGVCASACAYAFLGGVGRSLDEGAKLGFHRFYQENALERPSAKLFTGQDLGDAQIITAGLTLYTLKMGVDPSLIALAASAGPNEMHWTSREEAQKLRVTYIASAYKPWRVEPYKGGAIAVAERNDGSKNVIVSCSPQLGPNVALIDLKPWPEAASWYEECNKFSADGGHSILGTKVDPNRIRVIRRKDGSIVIRFQLPTNNPSLTSSDMFSIDDGYSRACSTAGFFTSPENFVPAIRLALRNCFQD